MYVLWLEWCQILYTKLIDKVKIEEQVELSNELLRLIDNEDANTFLPIISTLTINNIKTLLVDIVKGILLEYYSLVGNVEVYDRINKRSKEFVEKLNSGFSEEGYIMRERQLELIEKYLND